jgi:tyrosine-protein phosphatase SIW14
LELVMISRLIRRLALAGCIASTLCGCASQGDTATWSAPASALPTTLPSAQSQYPLAASIPGVQNFAYVTAELWRGALPTPQGLQSLARMGVRTIIDLQERDQSASVPAGVVYVPLRISEWRCDRLDTAAVLRAIRESPKPVFIHCHQGRDRTGLAVAAYRLSLGMTADQAIEEARRFGLNFWWQGPIESRIRQLARQAEASVR